MFKKKLFFLFLILLIVQVSAYSIQDGINGYKSGLEIVSDKSEYQLSLNRNFEAEYFVKNVSGKDLSYLNFSSFFEIDSVKVLSVFEIVEETENYSIEKKVERITTKTSSVLIKDLNSVIVENETGKSLVCFKIDKEDCYYYDTIVENKTRTIEVLKDLSLTEKTFSKDSFIENKFSTKSSTINSLKKGETKRFVVKYFVPEQDKSFIEFIIKVESSTGEFATLDPIVWLDANCQWARGITIPSNDVNAITTNMVLSIDFNSRPDVLSGKLLQDCNNLVMAFDGNEIHREVLFCNDQNTTVRWKAQANSPKARVADTNYAIFYCDFNHTKDNLSQIYGGKRFDNFTGTGTDCNTQIWASGAPGKYTDGTSSIGLVNNKCILEAQPGGATAYLFNSAAGAPISASTGETYNLELDLNSTLCVGSPDAFDIHGIFIQDGVTGDNIAKAYMTISAAAGYYAGNTRITSNFPTGKKVRYKIQNEADKKWVVSAYSNSSTEFVNRVVSTSNSNTINLELYSATGVSGCADDNTIADNYRAWQSPANEGYILGNPVENLPDVNAPEIVQFDLNFFTGVDFNGVTHTPNAYLQCNDSQSSTLRYTIRVNDVNVLDSNVSNNSVQNVSVNLNIGSNRIEVFCYDQNFNSVSDLNVKNFYAMNFLFINEETKGIFDVNKNLIDLMLVIVDLNQDYNLFKNDINSFYFSNASSQILNFEVTYPSGTLIQKEFSLDLLPDVNILRICMAEPQTLYQQTFTSPNNIAYRLHNDYADCYSSISRTRFSDGSTEFNQAHTIPKQYSLYAFDDGEWILVSLVDGSAAFNSDLDTLILKFRQYILNIPSDTFGFSKYLPISTTDSNILSVYYQSYSNNNLSVNIKVYDGLTLLTDYTNITTPNSINTTFDYTGISRSTNTLRIVTTITKEDGTSSTQTHYFLFEGKAGVLDPIVASIAAIVILFFTLTLTSTRLSFGWFGIFSSMIALAILTFATPTWYTGFLQAVVIIIGLYLVLVFKNESLVVS